MKEWISKHKRKLFISFFVFLFIIPLAINTFFKIKAPCAFFVAEWSAGDALSFYGTMLASVATIIGVYMSIRYAQKSYRDDIRNQVLPFFAVTQLRGKSHYDPFLDGWNVTENPEHENQSDISSAQYEESKLSKIYFCLEESGIKNYTDELLQKMGDIESHINGNDAVSLSVVGLQDLYPNEYEYDPFNPSQVDFLVSSEIQAGRLSIHYGNEFLSYKSIGVDKLKSVDIRLLELIELVEQGYSSSNFSIQSAIQKYNYLKNIALTMKNSQLDIPLREMSYQDNSLMDVDKLSTTPKLVLK